MKFLVITNAPTLTQNGQLCAYAPYVIEMDVWTKYVKEFKVVSPNQYAQELLTLPFKKQPELVAISSLQFSTVNQFLLSLLKIPMVLFKLYKAMLWADHIHLRCPGNIGLLGCVVQLFFPKKPKTAKYAGNWDPGAQQPLSYRIQKWLLSNTTLTKNMQVLVYGDWPNKTKNIKPFFTATYGKDEIETRTIRDYIIVLKFVFVGSLVKGKRPLLAIQIVEELHKQGKSVSLELFGDGPLRPALEQYIHENNLGAFVIVNGNQTKAVVKQALKEAHFSILPSKSEGWPKAIAEAMFFGAIPIVTKISCVPYMLDYGKRGLLIEPKLEAAVAQISKAIENVGDLELMSEAALEWSQAYTLDVFEHEVVKLLNSEK
ncbi:glycosyltransferase family 4 protein [Lacinutrix sp. Hel_I_90]|uniref:glycosyltransferase family 4 protein n=1 Tax=Lacinutrix sp. Hel_I_90 TaxID=1249999 RepID=UPI0005CABB1B|nr:glycosyltransferase family 4 protein [Lacinutrix sp. Hel_I_90]